VALSTAVAVGLGIFTALRATSGDVPRSSRRRVDAHSPDLNALSASGATIVAAQIAITLVLVIGAGLLAAVSRKFSRSIPDSASTNRNDGRVASLGELD